MDALTSCPRPPPPPFGPTATSLTHADPGTLRRAGDRKLS